MAQLRRKNVWLFILADIFIICLSAYGSYLLRFDFIFPYEFLSSFYTLLLVLIFSKLSINVFSNIYSGLWRYTSVNDLISIVKASTLGSIVSTAVSFLILGISIIPRSIFIIDYFLATIGMVTTRAMVRIYSNRIRQLLKPSVKPSKINKTKLLLLGAGQAGEKIVREIVENPSSPYELVGFLDDDSSKIHTTLHGIPVFGKIESIHTFNIPFDEIVICTSAASSSQMRRIVDHCKVVKKPYRTIPTVSELIDKKVSLDVVRDVSILDLLGRQEVNLNRSAISKYIYGKKVLVTGAG